MLEGETFGINYVRNTMMSVEMGKCLSEELGYKSTCCCVAVTSCFS